MKYEEKVKLQREEAKLRSSIDLSKTPQELHKIFDRLDEIRELLRD